MSEYKLIPGKMYYNSWIGARIVVLNVSRYSEATTVVEILRGKEIFNQYYSHRQLEQFFGDPI